MSAPIDFWFDFSSPYGYLMAERIDALAARHGREVRWRPFLLGAVFKHTGGQPLPAHPMKGPYSRHDLERSARFLGVPLKLPESFAVSSHQACRVYYWLESRDPKLARDAVAGATADDAVKNHLREVCEQAIAGNVFGSPFVVIDGEPFWGADRLPQIERWLETGGF